MQLIQFWCSVGSERLLSLVLVCGLAWVPSGCTPSLPRHQWTTDQAALQVLRERAEALRTIEASCTITMRDANGRQVTLDGALVAQKPDHLRMRAWKLHRPAFDITAKPDGVWIDAPRHGDSAGHDEIDSAALADHILRAWSVFSGDFLTRELRIGEPTSAGELALTELDPAIADQVTSCFIDRQTLTPQRYEVRRSDGSLVYAIRMDRHVQTGQFIWPRRVVFEGGPGTMTLEFEDIAINGEPGSNAFMPPRGSVRQR